MAFYAKTCTGGCWECLIGLTKMSLKKVLGRLRVILPVLQTLIAEVEVILNDLTLTHVSSDFDDAEPLTPAHLLHGHKNMSLPHEEVGEEELEDRTFNDSTDVNRQARLQSFLLGQFHSHWIHEYLTSIMFREHHLATSGINSQKIKTGDSPNTR